MKHAPWLLAPALAVSPHAANAQIVTDGTLGTGTTLAPIAGVYTIGQSLGQTAGGNLFHSFSDFNVGAGQEARFTGAGGLGNIIARVTGGDLSAIDGLVTIVGPAHANLFLINPAGIALNDGAQFDIPGSLYLSTAHELGFADGARFPIASVTPSGALSMAAPESFGFLGGQGRIAINAVDAAFMSGPGALSLSASDIGISDSVIVSTGLDLMSVGSGAELLALHQPLTTAGLSGEIVIDHSDIITEPGAGHGALRMGGGRLDVTGNSFVRTDTGSAGDGGDFAIVADRLRVDGGAGLGVLNFFNPARDAGDLHIAAHEISVSGSGSIVSYTAGTGAGGRVHIETDALRVIEGLILSDVLGGGTGRGGDVVIDAGHISLRNFSYIKSRAFGGGIAGDVSVNAQVIVLSDFGTIGTHALLYGAPGEVIIKSDSLILNDASSIASIAFYQPSEAITISTQSLIMRNNSNVSVVATVQAGGSLQVIGGDIRILGDAGISYSAGVHGEDGLISLRADSLRLDGGSIISYTSLGDARAPDIQIDANRIDLDNEALIKTATDGDGAAGDILIRAGALSVRNYSQILSRGPGVSPIPGGAPALGMVGDVFIDAGAIELIDGGRIAADSYTQARSGALTINADTLSLSGFESGINSENFGLDGGDAGSIDISARIISLYQGAGITSDAASGAAGDIDLRMPADGALILRRGEGEISGNLLILFSLYGDKFDIPLPEGLPVLISTSSGVESGGAITISSPGAIVADGAYILAVGDVLGANAHIASQYWVSSLDHASFVRIDGSLVLDASLGSASRGLETPDTSFFDASRILRGQCPGLLPQAETSQLRFAGAGGPYQAGADAQRIAARASAQCLAPLPY